MDANESGNTQAEPSSLDGTKAFLIADRIYPYCDLCGGVCAVGENADCEAGVSQFKILIYFNFWPEMSSNFFRRGFQ